MGFTGLNRPSAPSISPEHQQNLTKIAEYSKRLGMKPEKISHHFGEYETDENGKYKLAPNGEKIQKFVPYSEFSKDPEKTAQFVNSIEDSSTMLPKKKVFSSEELRKANVTPNYYDNLEEIVGDYKDEGVGSFISDYADDLEEDKALYTAILSSTDENLDGIEGALAYLYNASPATRAKIQQEYNRILSLRVGKKPDQINRRAYGYSGKLGDIID